MAGITPLMRQYKDIKKNHPDSILFFRMGDFYEMFGDDAVVPAKALQITLTTRGRDQGEKIPLCGVPYHAVDGYIAKLIRQGFRVAVCEQVEDPRQAKGIVRREVVRVITPGTLLEDNLLSASENNFLMSVAFARKKAGIAYADISTGEFFMSEMDASGGPPERLPERLIDELVRIDPKEILLPEGAKDDPAYAAVAGAYKARLNPLADWGFDPESGRQRLLDHFGVASLEGFGVEGMDVAAGAAGALFGYLADTHPGALGNITRARAYHPGSYMVLDETTQANLEITRGFSGKEGTLLDCLDLTVTSMGARMLKNWITRPLLDPEQIRARQGAVAELAEEQDTRGALREHLKGVHDIERLMGRITSGVAGPRDISALKASLDLLPRIKDDTVACVSPMMKQLASGVSVHGELRALIADALVDSPPATLKDGGVIRPGHDEDLDELRRLQSEGKGIIAGIEAEEKRRTGIESLKVKFNKVFGYYIEISNANLGRAPGDYIRKQTLVNAERFITPKLKEYEEKVLGAGERILSLEAELFAKLREGAAAHAASVQESAGALAAMDALASFAQAAVTRGYARPVVDESGGIEIVDGRHPVVERLTGMERYIPNDTELDSDENRLIIITGPNMAGKSTYMRQVALIVLMAQTGSFVPARSARVGVVDRIFTRVGASDNIARGQSTFMVEMNETANILNNATAKSLIILDEIGRGTSTFDGLSIAWAVAEYIHDKDRVGAKTLFATHYHELTELASAYPGIKNFNIAVREYKDEIIFLRKIVEGGSDKSYGIQVARLAGLPAGLLERAKEILKNLEKAEYDAAGKPNIARPSGPDEAGQLDIFSCPEDNGLARELADMDLINMTPIEAINVLSELKERAEGIIGENGR